MSGRVRRKLLAARISDTVATPAACALCDRPLGRRAEAHHVVPKSEGGTETALIHPICHRAIHAAVKATVMKVTAMQTTDQTVIRRIRRGPLFSRVSIVIACDEPGRCRASRNVASHGNVWGIRFFFLYAA